MRDHKEEVWRNKGKKGKKKKRQRNSKSADRSTTESIISTRPTASIIDLAIATDSVTITGPTASIISSTLATGLAASNEFTVPTGVESVLAGPIAATGQLMDVDMTSPIPPYAPDEIVP
ncbi:hypothetical protein E4T56_gene2970 [Termitomyces sp. T112]|nr:hypothetical protein E4T56_gene2970 [Termitomyces sp. T112]